MIKTNSVEQLKKELNLPDELIEFIKKANTETPCGKYFFSDNCYAMVQSYDSKPTTYLNDNKAVRMEAHKIYTDVQFLIAGEEKILYTNVDGLEEIQAYNPDKDVLFYAAERYETVKYGAGDAVILPPSDAHAPGLALDVSKPVKKIVVKIK